MNREKDLGRRWANRRATGSANVAPTTPEPRPLTPMDPAAQLLSDYEDACFASARHQFVTPGYDENAHLLESRRLHADVRRLRLEILDLLDIALGP